MLYNFYILSLLAFCVGALAYGVTDEVPTDRSWHEFDEIKQLTDPHNELTEVTLRIGPYTIKPHKEGSDTQSGPTFDASPVLNRPEPSKRIEIAFWGDWVLVDANDTEIPRPELYLHHILAYSNGHFITGCSSERTTWGVDHIPYPYRQVLEPMQQVKAAGFHYNNMVPKTHTFYVRYKVKYKVHDPAAPPVRVVRSFYWMDNYNVPGKQPINSTHTRPKMVRVPWKMVLVSANGHLHQGGEKLVLSVKSTGEVICDSRNLYHPDVDCYWDCPDICPYKPHGWKAQWGTSTCYMERPITPTTELVSTSFYDNSCSWRGVMAWWFNFGWDGKTIGGGNGDQTVTLGS